MIVFGPIPSRRLGRSLGINNIPPKICSYSCIYCQLGKTINICSKRKEFYSPDKLFNAVRAKVLEASEKNENIDYLSFVPDGEPTLDLNLGKEIDMLKSLKTKIAVFTNGSLISDKNVRKELAKADLVSVKIDTDNGNIWKKINYPDPTISFNSILKGVASFRNEFRGKLVTETMLIKGVNDSPEHIDNVAKYISGIKPDIAYILTPTRPPAVKTVRPPGKAIIKELFDIFSGYIDYVECLTEYEGNLFASTGDAEMDILSITSVHPMRRDGIEVILKKANKGWDLVDKLVSENKLLIKDYEDNKYYVRNLNYKYD